MIKKDIPENSAGELGAGGSLNWKSKAKIWGGGGGGGTYDLEFCARTLGSSKGDLPCLLRYQPRYWLSVSQYVDGHSTNTSVDIC